MPGNLSPILQFRHTLWAVLNHLPRCTGPLRVTPAKSHQCLGGTLTRSHHVNSQSRTELQSCSVRPNPKWLPFFPCPSDTVFLFFGRPDEAARQKSEELSVGYIPFGYTVCMSTYLDYCWDIHNVTGSASIHSPPRSHPTSTVQWCDPNAPCVVSPRYHLPPGQKDPHASLPRSVLTESCGTRRTKVYPIWVLVFHGTRILLVINT